MPLEFYENIQILLDIAIFVLTLIALLFLILLLSKLYQVCAKVLRLLNAFTWVSLRQTITQIERFCRRYAEIIDGKGPLEGFEEVDKE